MPNLADLNSGDLKHQVDFKAVYATLLNKWLQTDDEAILGKITSTSILFKLQE